MRLRDDQRIGLVSALLLVGLTVGTGVTIHEVMKDQVESSLGRGLKVTLRENAHHLISGLADAKEDTHGAASRPFLIKSLYQISVNPSSVIDLQNLKLNINSLLKAGFTAASAYDIHGKELASTGHFIRDLKPSFSLKNDGSLTLVWDPISKALFLHLTESVRSPDGHEIGIIKTEKVLKDLTRGSILQRSIGRSGEFMLCQPVMNSSTEMDCLLSQESGVKFRRLDRIVNNQPLPMNFALNGKTGVISTLDYRQIPVVAAYLGLTDLNLGMVLKLDEKELYESTNVYLYGIVLYISIAAVLGWILLYWLVLPLVYKLIQSESNLRNLVAYQEGVREEERRRIARDIHDQMGSDLSTMNILLESSKQHSKARSLAPDPYLVNAGAIITNMMNTVRSTINELHPPILSSLGLWDTLRWHCNQIRKQTDLQCELVIDELSESVDIEPDLSTSIFRIIQESITNVVRHAKASRVTIHVAVQGGVIVIEVADNGLGYPPPLDGLTSQGSLGVAGIRERCFRHQGSLEIQSAPGHGTTLLIRIPIGGSVEG